MLIDLLSLTDSEDIAQNLTLHRQDLSSLAREISGHVAKLVVDTTNFLISVLTINGSGKQAIGL
jgi:hypothetical protein